MISPNLKTEQKLFLLYSDHNAFTIINSYSEVQGSKVNMALTAIAEATPLLAGEIQWSPQENKCCDAFPGLPLCPSDTFHVNICTFICPIALFYWPCEIKHEKTTPIFHVSFLEKLIYITTFTNNNTRCYTAGDHITWSWNKVSICLC